MREMDILVQVRKFRHDNNDRDAWDYSTNDLWVLRFNINVFIYQSNEHEFENSEKVYHFWNFRGEIMVFILPSLFIYVM